MTSGSTRTGQSEVEVDWRGTAEGRQPSLKASIDSDMASLYDGRPSMDESRKPMSTTRRQSVRPAKQPQGARPLTRSPSKLPTSGTMRDSSRVVSNSSVKSTGVPRSRQSSYGMKEPMFDITATVPTDIKPPSSSSSQPFLPPVNFDDLHNSITMGEPNMDVATTSKRSLMSPPSLSSLKEEKGFIKTRQSMLPSTGGAQTLHRTSSSIRDTSKRDGDGSAHLQSTAQLMGPPSTSTSKSSRRQSHFPTSGSTNNVSKAPRKSVGPGILTQGMSSYAFLQDEPQFNDRRQSSFRRRQSRHESAAVGENGELRATQGRSSKTRSTYVPGSEDLLHTPVDSENPWSASSRSPHRDGNQENGTPGSSKRMSMNPAVVGGLGARTISPTDVKRMKRLSMIQGGNKSPPMTAQEPPPPFPAQYNDSPPVSAGRRKSTTPSSSRNTPDHNRRSQRGSVSTIQSVTQNNWQATGRRDSNSTPKSPTLKARTEGADDVPGDVPPVPAIPKAYESPKNEQDLIFVAASRKSAMVPSEVGSEHSGSPGEYVSARSSKASYGEPIRVVDTPNSSRGYAEEIGASLKNAADTAPSRKKRDPPRLPPLNLLPLSAPTAEKIAAIQNRASVAGSGAVTPPRKVARTPTTPMTASKANFPSRYHQKDATAPIQIAARSNTSQYVNTTDYASYRPPSSAASSVKGGSSADKEKGGRISPFVSSSAPKISGEFGAISSLRSKPSVDRSASTHSTEVRPSKLAGPRAQPSASHLRRQSTAQASTDTEATSNSFSSNLRRKLSLTRRRSTSKVDDQPPQPPAHTTMPPPKLPASATTGSLNKNGVSAARRKSSFPEALSKHAQSQQYAQAQNGDSSAHEPPVRKSFEYRTLDPKATPNPTSSSSRYSVAGNRSRNPIPAIDTKLDRDDQLAEQEMHKLATRRKKTEIEARELDALRQRAVPAERMPPTTALRAAQLNMFERGEIVDYEDVYFTGTPKADKLVGNLEAEAANFGYDDDRGDYNIVLGDHLSYRYEVVDVLGKGSFGQVVRCVDHKTGGLVAIKIIRNKKRFHQQALVEVNILQKLKDWVSFGRRVQLLKFRTVVLTILKDPEGTHSMVSFTQSFYFRGHLCISTELLGMNLYEFIKIHDFRGFSLKLIRRFAKQMLNSLVLLKGKKVIHCDLKPENILLAHPAHSEIKVIDFGSSCMENEKVYTYIQSRFYRSPEVILGMNYGMPIDMWSLGCILAELLTGFPLFPGENEQEQLACIMEVFGPPDKHLIEKSTRRKLFFDSLGKPRPVVSSKGKRRRPSSKTLQQALRCDDEAFISFLAGCLRWDPERRMKPDEAAQHEFVSGVKQSSQKSLRSMTTPNMSSMASVKRLNSNSTIRPLPNVPDSMSGRPSFQGRPRDISPAKTAPKRHSTVTATTFSSSSKRVTAASIQPQNSGLPRLGSGRTASGRQPDLASAAAATATAVSAGSNQRQ